MSARICSGIVYPVICDQPTWQLWKTRDCAKDESGEELESQGESPGNGRKNRDHPVGERKAGNTYDQFNDDDLASPGKFLDDNS